MTNIIKFYQNLRDHDEQILALHRTFDALGISDPLFENCAQWSPSIMDNDAAKKWLFDSTNFRNKLFMENYQIIEHRAAKLSQPKPKKNDIASEWLWNVGIERFRHIKNFTEMYLL